MNTRSFRTTWPLARIAVVGSLTLTLIAGLATTCAAQMHMSFGGYGPITVSPNPWCLGDPVLPTLNASGQATYDTDYSTTSYGNWVSKSGTFNGVRYNRMRTKTVVDVVYTDKLVRIGPGTGDAPERWFDGTVPYYYSEPFTPSDVVGTFPAMLNMYLQERQTTTTTDYTEYWYKSGNNWTYVGTGSGTLVAQSSGNQGMGIPASCYYDVVNCPR